MKALILCAGFGSRLMPLTKDKPKCMVEYNNKKIIDYIIEALLKNNIKEIGFVGGYLFDVLDKYLKTKYTIETSFNNKEYNSTNMVYTLFCALDFIKLCIKERQDLLISYSDIIYFKETIKEMIDSNKPLSIAIDKNWKTLWEKRFSNPLSDAETLKIDNDGRIIEIGNKATTYNDINGQYMGLIKVKCDFLPTMIKFYNQIQKSYDKKEFRNMYMTSFIQEIINNFNNVYCVNIYEKWIEIDMSSDLEIDI